MSDPADTPTILLVEDEFFTRIATADTLADNGFAVLEAQDAEEALRIVDCGPHIDLLFTDVNLPGDLDGLALARIVVERMPETKLVVTSGSRRYENGELPDAGTFLPKPYRGEQMCNLLRSQLER